MQARTWLRDVVVRTKLETNHAARIGIARSPFLVPGPWFLAGNRSPGYRFLRVPVPVPEIGYGHGHAHGHEIASSTPGN